MADDPQRLIERLHASETMAVVAVTGAGSRAISWLLSMPGASSTILEVLVPYSTGSLAEFLGYKPQQAVSVQTARDMAHRAYQRAVHLREGSVLVAGVACTATISTDRPKRGANRCHVATWDQSGTTSYSLELARGTRNRDEEEVIISKLLLRALADESHVDFDLPIELQDRERVLVDRALYEDPIQAFLANHVNTVTIHPEGCMVADENVQGGVLPGSFDPIHEGHTRLAAEASDLLRSPVTFELSVTNVDKPPLKEGEVRKRVAQFLGNRPVVISRAPEFSQKARLFPGCPFIIGWDTAVRLIDPRYYGGDETEMHRAINEIRSLGCRFLVAGRFDGSVFHTLEAVNMPGAFKDLFTPIPEARFRYDVSSTELRLARDGSRDEQ